MNQSSSIISHRGYSISKKDTDPALIKHYKQQLTITPFVEKKEYAHLAKPIAVYQETPQRLYMPRFFGLKEIGPASTDKVWSKQYLHSERLHFVGKMRPDQIPVCDVALRNLKERGGGVIAIECGGGKTTISLNIACAINEMLASSQAPTAQTAPTAPQAHDADESDKPVPFAIGVVCHTTSMMKQWQERIQQYVPNARIGVVQRDKIIVKDMDIVIMSVKTVALREFSKHAFDTIGLVIWDEIHLMCTRLFSQAFPKLATKYTLGLSATPYRNDKCEQIFQSFIGPVVYMRKRDPNDRIEARCLTFLMDDIAITYNRFDKIQYTPTTVATTNRPERCEWLGKYIADLGSAGRTVLVLSEYVSHLKTLQKIIDRHRPQKKDPLSLFAFMMGHHSRLGKHSPIRRLPLEICCKIASYVTKDVTTGLYIGALKNEQRKISEDKDIILGTYKLASVGMDIPSLNTLVFASPRKEIEQSVGRILRKEHDEFKPLIIDVIDNHSLYKSQASKRKKFFKTYGYTIVLQQVSPDGTIKSSRRAPTKKKAVEKYVEQENVENEEQEEQDEQEEQEENEEQEEQEENEEQEEDCMFE